MSKRLKICPNCEAIKINPYADLWITRATDIKLYDSFKENYKFYKSTCPDCKSNKRAKNSHLSLIADKPF